MSVQRLISDLNGRGIRLSVEADCVQIDAPKGVVADDDLEQLKQHKAEIIQLLANKDNVVCFLCHQPVERSQPDTGALSGQDLHMVCFRKRYPHGHQRENQ